MPPDTGGAPSRNRSLLAVEGSDHPLADIPGSRGLRLDRSLPGADEGFRGYCQLVAAGAAFGRWEIEIAQAAVAALHSLKERSRNSR